MAPRRGTGPQAGNSFPEPHGTQHNTPHAKPRRGAGLQAGNSFPVRSAGNKFPAISVNEHVLLIERYIVCIGKHHAFLTKRPYLMVVFLISNVIHGFPQQRRTHRKSAISLLPCKPGIIDIHTFYPQTRLCLYHFGEFGHRHGLGKRRQYVYMIRHSAYFHRYSTYGFNDTTYIFKYTTDILFPYCF